VNEYSRCGHALEARARTRSDRRFLIAYRTNAGPKVEERLLLRISDEYLDDMLARPIRPKLRDRLEQERRRRGPSVPRRGLWQRLFGRI